MNFDLVIHETNFHLTRRLKRVKECNAHHQITTQCLMVRNGLILRENGILTASVEGYEFWWKILSYE